MTTQRNFVRYGSQVEQIDADEQATFEKIADAMRREGGVTHKRYGHAVRVSHAKAHGLAVGQLTILDNLGREYAQGLFATPRSYDVLVRLAHVPGELLDDRRVSTPRGMAIKVLGAQGPRVPEHDGGDTHDLVLDTGESFPAPNAGAFLAVISTLAAATPAPELVKAAVSDVSLATNRVLNAVGLNSANLDFFGHPPRHPLAETYYSQAAIRHGDYVAKLRVRPISPALESLADEHLSIEEEDGLRRAVTATLAEAPAEYEVAVQLCTDLERMPVENANKVWDQDESPYVAVARLSLPAQNAYSEARRRFVEERVSFSPAHALEAHRPLGSIMRARLYVYPRLSEERMQLNSAELVEPRSISEVPA